MSETHNDNTHAPAEHHPKWLAHHFGDARQQYESGKLGMWVFLLTEILFFSGLFVEYAVFRATNPRVFVDGSFLLDSKLGAVNTVVLIFSSLTMALAVGAAQRGRRGPLVGLLAVTLVCGVAFLGIKSVEYGQKWKHRFVPGQARLEYWLGIQSPIGSADRNAEAPAKEFRPDEEYIKEHLAHAGFEDLSEEQLADRVRNLRSFVGIYFALTGLHALHVIIGIGVIAWILVGAVRGRFNRHNFTPVDLVGLYWHLVDLIWIFLFPLLYLIH